MTLSASNASNKYVNRVPRHIKPITDSSKGSAKTAILSNANSIMLFHTYPSGSLNPSREDIAMTDQLQKACTLMNIPIMDYIILGRGNQYYSFREKDMLPMDKVVYATKLDVINLKVAEKHSVGKRLQEKKEVVAGNSASLEKKNMEKKMER